MPSVIQQTDIDLGQGVRTNAARIVNAPDPINPQDVATRAWTLAQVESLAWKDEVRVASTANVNLAAPGASIDGVALTTNDRVLLKDQTANTENGLWQWNGAAAAMTRTLDGNVFAELRAAIVPVAEGTSNVGTQWRQTTASGTLGTNAVQWVTAQSSSPGASEATPGLIAIAATGDITTGTNDTKAVTIAKLANWTGRSVKYAATFGDGSAVTYTLNHGLATADINVNVIKVSTGEPIVCTVLVTSTQITLQFVTAPAVNEYRVIAKG